MVNDAHQFVAGLLGAWPQEQWQGRRMVLAVSGGADSVALLRAIHGIAGDEGDLLVAHFNHGWRGAQSDQDQQFVEQLSHRLSVACTVGRNENAEHPDRSEQTARRMRYDFLQSVATEHAAQFIVTAHTASDRIETMLHNLCRGTGLSGVCSLRSSRMLTPSIALVRPLLGHFRKDVLAYLEFLGQPYRDDSSNEDENYRRNFLRHSVLPLLRQAYGDGLDHRLLSFSQLAEESVEHQREFADNYLLQLAEVSRLAVMNGTLAKEQLNQIVIPCRQMLPAAWPSVLLVVQQAWEHHGWSRQAIGRTHWDRLRSAWEETQLPKRPKQTLRLRSLFQLPGAIAVFECNGWLILSPRSGRGHES